MAKTNKYTSLNFNDIYEKKPTTTNTNHNTSTSSFNKTLLSNSRIHGNMLVLTRPSPKPTPPPPVQTSIQPDPISLRPLGRTGSPSPSPLPLPLSHFTVAVTSKKTNNKFVPPHLRPGFHGREEKPEPEIIIQNKNQTVNLRDSPLGFRLEEEQRPKSGGGYDRVNRLRSNRPFSSG